MNSIWCCSKLKQWSTQTQLASKLKYINKLCVVVVVVVIIRNGAQNESKDKYPWSVKCRHEHSCDSIYIYIWKKTLANGLIAMEIRVLLPLLQVVSRFAEAT